MSEPRRRYEKKARAEAQQATRSRIVEAAVRLHETVGPRATTISGIAKEAGVQRLTVYRHFPDETAIFRACTSHWLGLNPPPDPQGWSATAGVDRVGEALADFYAYYGRTRRMWTASFRDVETVPALQKPMAEFAGFVRGVAEDLAGRLGEAGGGPNAAATIRHALHFLTWKELDEQGLPDASKVGLVLDWLQGTIRGGDASGGRSAAPTEARDGASETGR